MSVDESNLRCDRVEVITSSVPTAVNAIVTSAPEDPLEILIVTEAGWLHRWSETRGLEALHQFNLSALVPRDTGALARIGPSRYAATAGGDEIVFVDPQRGVQTRSVPITAISPRGLRDLAFVPGLGLFGVEGRDALFHFGEDLEPKKIQVPSSFLISRLLALDQGVLLFLRGGSLLQWDARRGFCPMHDLTLVDHERSIEEASITSARVIFIDGRDDPSAHVLEIPISPTRPPLLPP